MLSNMQENGSRGNNKWVEEDLFKLPCKELKKLARQSNINPNCRKADLVKALLSIDLPSISNNIETKENKSSGRMTRSRASTSQPLSTILQDSECRVNEILDQANELKGQNKRKMKQKIKSSAKHDESLNMSGVFKLVSSIEANEQPLDEITNKTIRESRKTKRSSEHAISQDELISKDEPILDSGCNHSENDKLEKSSSFKAKPEKKTRKQGRKKNVAEQNIKEVESSLKETIVETTEDKCSIKSRAARRKKYRINEECMVKEDEIKVVMDEEESGLDGSVDKICDLNKENRSEKQLNNDVIDSEGTKLKGININDNLSPEVLLVNLGSGSAFDNTSIEREIKNSFETKNSVTSNSPFIEDHQPPSCNISKSNNMLGTPEMPRPVRGATFVLDDKDAKQTRSSSSTKPQEIGAVTEKEPSTNLTHNDKGAKISAKRNNFEKYIGNRILTSALKQGQMKSVAKRGTASTIKKTITKQTTRVQQTTTTPGSAYRNKFGIAKKAPNFKTIHKKIFGNMESIQDNRKRILERAQELMQSPIVPSCAFSRKSLSTAEKVKEENTASKKLMSPTPVNVIPSASRSITKVSTAYRQPILGSSSINHKPILSSSSVNSKPIMSPSSVTRFGFKKRITKEDAKVLVGSKTQHKEGDKKKEQRTILQGVRMNKRFMLQMKMRNKD